MKFKPGDNLSYYLGPDAKSATAAQCAELEQIFADASASMPILDSITIKDRVEINGVMVEPGTYKFRR